MYIGVVVVVLAKSHSIQSIQFIKYIVSEGSTSAWPGDTDTYPQPRCQDTELAKNIRGVSENYVYRHNASEIGETRGSRWTGH